MVNKYEYSAAAKRRKRRKQRKQRKQCKWRRLMIRRISCLVVSAGIIIGSAYAFNQYHTKSIQALQCDIDKFSQQVTELTTRNHELSAALQQSNDKLRLFVDDTEVRAAEPTYYDIPLSKDLQLYTYNKCIEYGIPDHYELVLAMMWQESNYTADLISETDDYGIMQINSCNHDWLVDLLGPTNFLDANDNINAGVYIISKLLIKYEDEHMALMSYNMGEHAASLNWQAGNYTSNYSRSVMAKREAIKVNNYNAN